MKGAFDNLTVKFQRDVRSVHLASIYHHRPPLMDEIVSLLGTNLGEDTEHDANRRFKDGMIIMVLAATNRPWHIDEAF